MSNFFLSAYTAANGTYPAFVNISATGEEWDDLKDLIVTVRRASDHPTIHYTPVEIAIPREEAKLLLKNALFDFLTWDEVKALAAELAETVS